MTAENQNEESSNERPDQRNLSVQGSVDKSALVVGDQNTVKQESNYYTSHRFGFFKTEKSPKQRQHLRKQLLKQMKTDVAQRLEDSLHNLIRVDLEQEEQRQQVGRPRKGPLVEVTPTSTEVSHELVKRELAVSNSNEARESIPPAEQTYNIFHRSDIGGRLLILGEPGAGKTTELLTVAQRFVEAAVEDNEQPIPLIFELSSWTPNIPILRWLGQQLQTSYGVSKTLAAPLAQQWVQQTRVLPLLDGLDELGQRNQIACIEALEDFLSQHPTLQAVVCCRREEYEQGGELLKQLNGAIYLQAVRLQQIQQYLKDLGRETLWDDIQAAPELLALAQSPLFLTMLVIVYQGQPIRDQSALFNAYIQKQLNDLSHQGTYKPGKEKSSRQTLHYLGWLAGQLNKRKETEFLIEKLQPDWLEVKQQKRMYRIIIALIFGLVLVLNGLLTGGFAEGENFNLPSGLVGGLIFGFMFMLWGGKGFGLVGGLSKIDPIEYRWKLRKGVSIGIVFGSIGGLSFGLLTGLLSGLRDGLIIGLSTGIIGVLMSLPRFGGLGTRAIEQKQVPNQGITKSIQNGLLVGLIFGMPIGLLCGTSSELSNGEMAIPATRMMVIGLITGLSNGCAFGLTGGLGAALQHFTLRIFLTRNDCVPWNYAKFLEHAARHRFIQRTGGRYRFIHDLLRQHFAQITPEQQQSLLAQSASSNRPYSS